jgi:hypothetical protein
VAKSNGGDRNLWKDYPPDPGRYRIFILKTVGNPLKYFKIVILNPTWEVPIVTIRERGSISNHHEVVLLQAQLLPKPSRVDAMIAALPPPPRYRPTHSPSDNDFT